MSSHDLIFLSYGLQLTTEPQKYRCFRVFKRIDIPKLCIEASNMPWDDFYSTSEIDTLANIFTNKLNFLLDSSAPLKKRLVKEDNIPWFNSEVEKLIIDRDLAFSKWKCSRTISNKNSYKILRNRVVFFILQ